MSTPDNDTESESSLSFGENFTVVFCSSRLYEKITERTGILSTKRTVGSSLEAGPSSLPQNTISVHNFTRNVLDCDQSNYSSRIIFPYTFTLYRTKYELDRMNRFRDMAIKLYKTADGRDLGFGPIGCWPMAIRSTDPENPIIEPNAK